MVAGREAGCEKSERRATGRGSAREGKADSDSGSTKHRPGTHRRRPPYCRFQLLISTFGLVEELHPSDALSSALHVHLHFCLLFSTTMKDQTRMRTDAYVFADSFPACQKAYGTLNHLNAHVTMQKHGVKRSPAGERPFLSFSPCSPAVDAWMGEAMRIEHEKEKDRDRDEKRGTRNKGNDDEAREGERGRFIDASTRLPQVWSACVSAGSCRRHRERRHKGIQASTYAPLCPH